MNPQWFGDSYDLVKRALLEVVRNVGFEIYAEPMFTGTMKDKEKDFYKLINARPIEIVNPYSQSKCLFIDPDIGLSEKKTNQHVTFDEIHSRLTGGWSLVVIFDQSFSRAGDTGRSMEEKLVKLKELGIHAFYYSSHAYFLFASMENKVLQLVKWGMRDIGIPETRIR